MTTKTTYYNYRNDEGGMRHNWVYVKEPDRSINWLGLILFATGAIIIAALIFVLF